MAGRQFATVLVEGSSNVPLQSSFPLERAYEEGYFVSLLYYMGLLTQRPEGPWTRLAIPNYAIRTLYWETIAKVIREQSHVDIDLADFQQAIEAMALGDLGPFLNVAYTKAIRKLSNRDMIRLDEKTMKVLLLAYLSLSEVFFAWSEAELGFGYGDLVLVPSRIRPGAEVGLVIELKYVKASEGEGVVAARLDEADHQLRRYLGDAKLQGITRAKRWKGVSVAFVGTEACYFRELGGELRRVGEA